MICPWEHCTAEFLPLAQQAAPGSDRTIEVVPWHPVAGEARWFGTCPATHLIVPTLTAAGRGVLAEATRHYERMRADRLTADAIDKATAPSPGGDATPIDAPRLPASTWFTEGGGAKPGAPNGATARDRLELVPDTHVNQGGGSGNMSDALRDQLRALAMLAVDSLHQVQLQAADAQGKATELSGTTVALIDDLDGQLRALMEKVEAAETVTAASIGSNSPPQSAADMLASASALREKVELAEARLTGLTTEVETAAAAVGQAMSELLGLAHAAAEAGETYIRSI
jgi:hypothetical protein